MTMKKTAMFIVIVLWCYKCFAPEGIECLYIQKPEPCYPFNIKDPVLRAVAFTETRFNPDTVNADENAGGLLQIRTTMINEVNRICIETGSPERFVLDDRMNPDKSIRIWWIVQNYHNPKYNLKIACLIWNGRGKGNELYYKSVRSICIKQI